MGYVYLAPVYTALYIHCIYVYIQPLFSRYMYNRIGRLLGHPPLGRWDPPFAAFFRDAASQSMVAGALVNHDGSPLEDSAGDEIRKGVTVRDSMFGQGIATGTVPLAKASRLAQSHPRSIRVSSASTYICVG